MLISPSVRKPKHKKKVIATQRGWKVEETGELLRSDRNLLSKLEQLKQETKEAVQEPTEPPQVETLDDTTTVEPTVEKALSELDDTSANDPEPVVEEAPSKPVEQKQVVKKKRGRPPKNKAQE